VTFATATTYITERSSNLEVYVGGTKTATFESDGGVLHGSWNVESSLVTSDRRLKTNIMPLQRTLRDVVAPRGEKKASLGSTPTPAAGQEGGKAKTGDGALWLLRQLRPVSYSFRKGMDSKYMRFGFIADELESVVPEVVRHPGDREVTDQKAVVYQDLIALLAAASQSQQKLIESQTARVESMEAKLMKLEENQAARLLKLEQKRIREEEEKKKREKNNKPRTLKRLMTRSTSK
jgi:hypothetical protein